MRAALTALGRATCASSSPAPAAGGARDPRRRSPSRHARPDERALALFREAYAGEPFVESVTRPRADSDVQHRNVARIGAVASTACARPTLLVFAAIDNLLKGAAGQRSRTPTSCSTSTSRGAPTMSPRDQRAAARG
jgi:hypothetical protein